MGLSFLLADRLRLAYHFLSSTRKRGLRRTLQIALCEALNDWKFGINTGLVIPAEALDGDRDALQHASDYFPSSYLVLKEALRRPDLDLRDAVFIDFGCGLGRALLFASELPLRRLIGIEISPRLCAAARQNMSDFYRRRHKVRPEWSVINDDARIFGIPDDATIFYFFNPFDAIVLRAVIKRIRDSVSRVPRDCTIIYANPVHQSAFADEPSIEILNREADYVIYRLNPNRRGMRATSIDPTNVP